MNKKILSVLAGGLLIGAFAAPYAKLPPPTPEEKAAAAAKSEKEGAAKATAAKELAKAQDRAVANYKKNKGSAAGGGATAQPGPESQSAAPPPAQAPGADHATTKMPDAELTRREAQTEMPKPGQANDHSTTARDPQNSGGR
jgi:hypothetical protein